MTRSRGASVSDLQASRLGGPDAGSALIEFAFLGVLLFVPLVYLVLSVFAVQRAAYGATAAAREAGRAWATAGDDAEGRQRAYAAAALALGDQGLALRPSELTVDCPTTPCLSPGATLTVRVDTRVPLPLVPDLLGGDLASVAVSARHDAVVDAYRGFP
jgi:Flp pilus assembly protein TadG